MSVEYGIVSLEKKQALARYGNFLSGLKDTLIRALDEYKKQDPSIQAEADDVQAKIMVSDLFQTPEAMQERHIIALCTSEHWYWRHENSFSRVEDVRRFLDTHPGCAIEDVYGEAISLPELEAIIRTRQER